MEEILAMGWVVGDVADRILARYRPRADAGTTQAGAVRGDHLRALLGDDIFERTRGRRVLDFGCGCGADAVALAVQGAREVVGVDIVEASLRKARDLARREGVADRCHFATDWSRPVDLILSIDAFEHFADPAAVLARMARLLQGGDGEVLVSFGPTWLHPLGGHLFSVFPWAHLVFGEAALLRWRRRFRDDGATCFGEVEGGLNQMTIARFERLVAASPLRLESLEEVPIRRLRLLHGRWTREFTTSLLRARLSAR